MNFFQRPWRRRDLPTETITKPIEPYADSATRYVDEGEQLDIDLAQYVRAGPVEVIEKPYFIQVMGSHATGQVPIGKGKRYEIIIEDGGDE